MTIKPTKTHRLGALQLKIMQILWDLKEADVHGVLERIQPQQELAYTTIATMLRKMEEKQLVQHRTQDRSYIYSALVSKKEVTGNMMDDVLQRLFSGSVSEMFAHLIHNKEVGKDELVRLEKLIKEKKKKS